MIIKSSSLTVSGLWRCFSVPLQLSWSSTKGSIAHAREWSPKALLLFNAIVKCKQICHCKALRTSFNRKRNYIIIIYCQLATCKKTLCTRWHSICRVATRETRQTDSVSEDSWARELQKCNVIAEPFSHRSVVYMNLCDANLLNLI